MGEVSRDLEKADQRRGNKHRKAASSERSEDVPQGEDAEGGGHQGSAPSTAHEYEQLASGEEEQAVKAPHLPIAPASSIH